jgi:hypothetical protein
VFGNAVISRRPLARGAVFRSEQTLQSSRSTPLGRTKRSIGSATTWPCDYRASTGPPGRSTSSTFGCRDLPRCCRLPFVSRSRNGMPAEGYPCHWSVCRWLAGENAIIERIADLRQAAIALAPFVAQPCSGSIPRAGRPLSAQLWPRRAARNHRRSPRRSQTRRLTTSLLGLHKRSFMQRHAGSPVYAGWRVA